MVASASFAVKAALDAWVGSVAVMVGHPYLPTDVGSLAAGIERDMDQAQWRSCRWGLDHRACRHAHRTPVLYSRNQSRTNIALLQNHGKEGAGQLAELLIMSLKWRWIIAHL